MSNTTTTYIPTVDEEVAERDRLRTAPQPVEEAHDLRVVAESARFAGA